MLPPMRPIKFILCLKKIKPFFRLNHSEERLFERSVSGLRPHKEDVDALGERGEMIMIGMEDMMLEFID